MTVWLNKCPLFDEPYKRNIMENDEKKEHAKELESKQAAPENLFVRANGKLLTIHSYHVDFFEQILKLDVATRIELMKLTPKQMGIYISKQKMDALNKVIELLEQKWYWKDSGDEVELTIDTIPSVPYSIGMMKAKNRSLETYEKIIAFFEGDDREVCTKED